MSQIQIDLKDLLDEELFRALQKIDKAQAANESGCAISFNARVFDELEKRGFKIESVCVDHEIGYEWVTW